MQYQGCAALGSYTSCALNNELATCIRLHRPSEREPTQCSPGKDPDYSRSQKGEGVTYCPGVSKCAQGNVLGSLRTPSPWSISRVVSNIVIVDHFLSPWHTAYSMPHAVELKREFFLGPWYVALTELVSTVYLSRAGKPNCKSCLTMSHLLTASCHYYSTTLRKQDRTPRVAEDILESLTVETNGLGFYQRAKITKASVLVVTLFTQEQHERKQSPPKPRRKLHVASREASYQSMGQRRIPKLDMQECASQQRECSTQSECVSFGIEHD